MRERLYFTNKCNKKSKYFTVIGLSKSLGEPICCIVIIEVKEYIFWYQDWYWFSKDKFGDNSDIEK